MNQTEFREAYFCDYCKEEGHDEVWPAWGRELQHSHWAHAQKDCGSGGDSYEPVREDELARLGDNSGQNVIIS